ncbi:helix-turn-helix domain-containing protein [Paenibacillus vortex]|uniref:helix-turn-helix domain-containing protein n=1 Tax=Paenibacillus vortex TaxID=71995 RepID=UPI001F1B7217|nr:helix-turn-helix domain-containing protein [Paenibacillus vortex]
MQSVRHREARRLLRESDISIEAVGEGVGYPDIHYFSRIFRRLEGITATDYRKLSRIL